MRTWARLKIEENPGLGRIYRNGGGQPIGGEVAVRILDDHAVLEVSLTGLRPLGGNTRVLPGPLAVAASALAYQVLLFSEWNEGSVRLGLLNADQSGSARMTIDFDPNDVCREGTNINGYDAVAITPFVGDCSSIGAMTIAYTRLPGDLATFQDRPILPNWLAPETGDKDKEVSWESEPDCCEVLETASEFRSHTQPARRSAVTGGSEDKVGEQGRARTTIDIGADADSTGRSERSSAIITLKGDSDSIGGSRRRDPIADTGAERDSGGGRKPTGPTIVSEAKDAAGGQEQANPIIDIEEEPSAEGKDPSSDAVEPPPPAVQATPPRSRKKTPVEVQ